MLKYSQGEIANMNNKISEIVSIWKDKVEHRNPYTFGEEDISLSEFSELFKDTFEIIKKAKNDFIYKGALPEDTYTTLDYLDLITALSKYITYDCVDDESESKTFTATCLVAQKLVEYATYCSGFRSLETGKYEYFDSDEIKQGSLTFLRADYPYYSDDFFDKSYEYRIYDGNFDQILELASQL